MKILTHLDLLLVKKKIKLKELAAATGLSEQALSVIKTGKAGGLRFTTLAAICNFLNCQPGDLLEFVKEDI